MPALSAEDHAAVRDLEHRVVDADGGRLKLEWGVLDAMAAGAEDDPRLALWHENDRVLGFLGTYAFGNGDTAELAGMVDPEARRRGIGSALLAQVLPMCRRLGLPRVLLVAPRNGAGGAGFARAHGGTLDHSEHALVLTGEPAPGPTDPAVTVRRAGPQDAEAVGRILASAFDWTPPDLERLLGLPDEETLLVLHDKTPVGTVRLSRAGESAGIYGFAVAPAYQGRGIGRDVLRRCCVLLRDEGAQRIGLEVEVDNERALGLYTSIGFQPVLTEDYYALP